MPELTAQRWMLLTASAVFGLALGAVVAWRSLPHPSTSDAGAAVPSAAAAPASAPAPAPPAAPDPLMPDLSSADALASVLAATPGTLVIDVHAPWCQPCALLTPRLHQLALAHPALTVRGVDAATTAALADKLGVDTLPTLIRYEHGREIDRRVGAPTSAELTAWLLPPPTAASPTQPR